MIFNFETAKITNPIQYLMFSFKNLHFEPYFFLFHDKTWRFCTKLAQFHANHVDFSHDNLSSITSTI